MSRFPRPLVNVETRHDWIGQLPGSIQNDRQMVTGQWQMKVPGERPGAAHDGCMAMLSPGISPDMIKSLRPGGS